MARPYNGSMHCKHHPTCPGCPLLDHSAAEQLTHKQRRLQRAFDAFAHLNLGDVPAVQAALHTEGYRHRLKLPVHIGQNRPAIGLIDPTSGRTLHTPDCPVLAPALREALPELMAVLHRQRAVHSVDLRVSHASGALQLVLAVRNGQLPNADALIAQLQDRIPTLTSISLSTADPKRRRVMGRSPQLHAGTATITERIGETELHIFPGAFFQPDPRSATQLHDLVREAVGDAQNILDLYAGVGAYARMLAPGRGRIVAVEEIPAAAAAAQQQAPDNVRVIGDRVENQDLTALGAFDATIVNPARRGSRPEVLAQIAQTSPRLVYVSCSPETLARDLDILAHHGMRAQAIQPLDLFPQTAEVETVVTLCPAPPLQRWSVDGGHAVGPWGERPSGAVGRPRRLLALLIGDTGEHGSVRDARYRRIGRVAGHSLVRIDLKGAAIPVLAALAKSGHPVAGRHRPTNRFFSETAGLIRPFVHVERAGNAAAPLHGDLTLALRALDASPRLLARAGAVPDAVGTPQSRD